MKKRYKYKNPLLLTIGGVTKTLSGWCKHFNIPHDVVAGRLRAGWFLEDALTTQHRNRPMSKNECVDFFQEQSNNRIK